MPLHTNTALLAQDVYIQALALTFTNEANAQDFRTFFLSFLNLCCAEALNTENAIRQAYNQTEEGKAAPSPLLFSAPLFTDPSFGEVIPYQESIVRTALPYGIASYYFQDDMDDWRYAEHRQRFLAALKEADRIVYTGIEFVPPDRQEPGDGGDLAW